jgi:cell division protein FtsW
MTTRSRRRAGDRRDDFVPPWSRAGRGGTREMRDAGRNDRRLPGADDRNDRRSPRSPGPTRVRAAGGRSVRPRATALPGLAQRRLLLMLTFALLLYGLVMAYSASTAKAFFTYGSSYYVIERQAIFAAIGVAAMLFLSRVDYVWWQRAALPLCAVALAALVLVLVPGIGTRVNNAQRWIIINGFSFSPSELAKLACITLAAGLVVQRPDELLSGKGFTRLVLACVGPAAALIMLEPDLGTTVILTFAVVSLLIVAGARGRHVVTMVAGGLTVVGLLIVLEPYRMARITTFLHPWKDPQGAGFQTTQSLISIASGHLFGVGLGNSIQKFGFLPEQSTDMITGIIGEELGLVGLLVLVVLYVGLVWTILHVALSCRELYGKLLAVGIGCAIAGQAAINIGGALGVLPLTGVPLPLVSCGGTSLVVVLASVGIVANIATNRRSYIVASPERKARPGRGGGDRWPSDAGARSR